MNLHNKNTKSYQNMSNCRWRRWRCNEPTADDCTGLKQWLLNGIFLLLLSILLLNIIKHEIFMLNFTNNLRLSGTFLFRLHTRALFMQGFSFYCWLSDALCIIAQQQTSPMRRRWCEWRIPSSSTTYPVNVSFARYFFCNFKSAVCCRTAQSNKNNKYTRYGRW